MAVISPTFINDGDDIVVKWTNILAADTCRAYCFSGVRPVSVQVTGTPDSATLAIQGSNDASTFAAFAAALSFTAAGVKTISERYRCLKPVTSGGGGSSSLTVSVYATRGN